MQIIIGELRASTRTSNVYIRYYLSTDYTADRRGIAAIAFSSLSPNISRAIPHCQRTGARRRATKKPTGRNHRPGGNVARERTRVFVAARTPRIRVLAVKEITTWKRSISQITRSPFDPECAGYVITRHSPPPLPPLPSSPLVFHKYRVELIQRRCSISM